MVKSKQIYARVLAILLVAIFCFVAPEALASYSSNTKNININKISRKSTNKNGNRNTNVNNNKNVNINRNKTKVSVNVKVDRDDKDNDKDRDDKDKHEHRHKDKDKKEVHHVIVTNVVKKLPATGTGAFGLAGISSVAGLSVLGIRRAYQLKK